jgi:mannose/fructose-specific phosphotransferase system component IIA
VARLEGTPSCVLGGANAAMLLRAINYRQGSLEDVAASALAGAAHSVLRVD